MKLSLPASFRDLTLQGMITLRTSNDPTEWVVACGNVTKEYVKAMPLVLFEKAKQHLQELLETEEPNHPAIIKLDGVEYGFIPNWSEFTTGEWVDLEMWAEDFWPNADKIMSLLYRPVTRRMGPNYEIAKYTATESRELFHGVSASYFAGAMLFFWTTKNKLLKDLRVSLMTVAQEAMTSHKSGDGTTTSIQSVMAICSRWMQSLKNRLKLSFSILHI